jgi:hypothetical protein
MQGRGHELEDFQTPGNWNHSYPPTEQPGDQYFAGGYGYQQAVPTKEPFTPYGTVPHFYEPEYTEPVSYVGPTANDGYTEIPPSSRGGGDDNGLDLPEKREWRDLPYLILFLIHLIGVGE